jgi:hypothetical protein
MNKLLASLLPLLFVVGCAVPTKKDVADKWVGKHISAAISELGPPTSTTPLPDGVTIYTWSEEYGSATAVSRAQCRKGLHANKEGIIVDASQMSGSLLCK